jgi:isocitrate dehydrogenase (NAD+)
MAYTITLIPGDGVGPEVIEAARRVVEATGIEIQWELQETGEKALRTSGSPIPDEVLENIRKNKVALKGPITTPVGTGFRSVNVAIRKALDLYVNLRPARSFPGVKSFFPNLDLVIVRENTEDLYAGIEFEQASQEMRRLREFMENEKIKVSEDAACSFKLMTWKGSIRAARFAFEYAVRHKRKKVTVVHKANIMKATDGLFLRAAKTAAEDFPEVEFEDRIVDNMCMQLVQKPELYDVLLLPNLYGDIVSDLCAGLVGGLGLAPSANLGERAAVFEPVHGSAPRYAGQNKVNPMAAILSACLMLRHLGEVTRAEQIESAISQVLGEGKMVTYDVKSTSEESLVVGTKEVADEIIARMKELSRKPY